jgi:hypothetical protein
MAVEWSSSYICSKCNATRKVARVLEEGIDPDTKNPFRKIELECGHIEKILRVSKELTLKPNTKVSVRPVEEEGVPVAVSEETTTQIASFSGLQGSINNIGQLTVERLTINNITYNTTFTSTTYNIHDILIRIDNSNHSPEEKEKIKQVIKIVDSEIKSKPLPQIFSSLSNNLKSILPLAAPFIVPFITKFLSG